MKFVTKPLAIAALSIAMLTQAVAQVPDELPYKEDGPERDFFLKGAVRFCIQDTYWQKLGANEKETAQFCDCRALALADIWTREDDLELQRSRTAHTKVPAETYGKWTTANLACQKHFSKLKAPPSRSK
jgi:hypothetical protein